MTHIAGIFALIVLFQYRPAVAATIPSQEIKQVVGFVFVQRDKSGSWSPTGNWQPNGTAFLVSVDDIKNPGRIFQYLVTAKHVLQYVPNIETPNRKEWYPSIRLRFNTTDGESDFGEADIILDGDKKPFFYMRRIKT